MRKEKAAKEKGAKEKGPPGGGPCQTDVAYYGGGGVA